MSATTLVSSAHQARVARFVEPVGDHGGRRHHQRRPARGAVEQQREGLHGLAEAHVVGQTRARAPPGKPREPAEAVVLIGAKLRLQRARQLRLERVRAAQALVLRAPSRVRIEGRALGEVPQRERRRGVHAYRAARGRRGEAAQIVEVAAQRRRQRDELAGSELQESRSGARIEQREQLLEIEGAAFVDLERAGGALPSSADRAGP